MLAVLAPGQGAQQQGFLSPWLTHDGVRANLDRFSAAAGLDLVAAGTIMSDADITDTAVAQPLIVAASLMTAALLPDLPADTILAGHSVGEFAAGALAGSLDPDDAMRLVAIRGRAMAAASAAPPSGMLAILGGDPAEVAAAIAAAGCSVANHNAAGQVVAAGTREALDRLVANPPAGGRLRPLAVAGAFHTSLMAPAREAIASAAAQVTASDPAYGLLSNSDGALVTDGASVLERLVSQVCSPVRWDLCMQTLGTLGVTATIELAPAGTLTALVRRALPGVDTVALRGPDDLERARTLIDEHAAELTDVGMPWQILVAPAGGTVSAAAVSLDHPLAAGDVVMRVTTRTEQVDVKAAVAGHLVEWLVQDGDPVNAGQPLARVIAEVPA